MLGGHSTSYMYNVMCYYCLAYSIKSAWAGSTGLSLYLVFSFLKVTKEGRMSD